MSSYPQAPDSPLPGPADRPVAPESPERLQQPQFALPAPAQWHYKPRRRFWANRTFWLVALFSVLALCGVIILALVRRQTGTEGLLVGLILAVLPVPILGGAFLWLDRVEPTPLRDALFAFVWGACAATLVALLANTYATELLATAFTATDSQSNVWGATFVAPVVEESTKGAAILLLFLFRRRDFTGIVDGVVIAGLTATGFAFTENILYLGSGFAEDQAYGPHGGLGTTAAMFVVRIVMTPFAHPLFTSLTGIGFAIAATSRPGQARRWLAPVGGWLLAMVLHGTWNGSASFSPLGFLAVYATVMVPLLGLLVWLAIWSRSNELKTIRAQLPQYAMAGWLSPPEPTAIGSMRGRGLARSAARAAQGKAAARAVREYVSFATSLAFLRARANRGAAGADFQVREQELLHHLWERKAVAQPALVHAAHAIRPVFPPVYSWVTPSPYGQPWPLAHAWPAPQAWPRQQTWPQQAWPHSPGRPQRQAWPQQPAQPGAQGAYPQGWGPGLPQVPPQQGWGGQAAVPDEDPSGDAQPR
ncbi:PrsW family glutamic-type intramembrane protease [Actinacidiphila sp. bgisy167]|uniref:PrsW family intramembrane metalloprotease n=1 Tax=Actinacidiphila sp. bgisy167 TaxID=3413797 RepID=UPI003D72289E